jgi:hypothetical protein
MPNNNQSSIAQTYESKHVDSLLAQDNWITIKQFSSQFLWPSESAMRSYVFKADLLGLQPAFLKVGRRLLVNPKKFFQMIQKINSKRIER